MQSNFRIPFNKYRLQKELDRTVLDGLQFHALVLAQIILSYKVTKNLLICAISVAQGGG